MHPNSVRSYRAIRRSCFPRGLAEHCPHTRRCALPSFCFWARLECTTKVQWSDVAIDCSNGGQMRQHSSRRIDILSEPLKQATPISPTRSISRSSIGDIVQCIIEAPYPKDTSLSSSACYSGTSALRTQRESGAAEIDAPRMQPKNEGCAIMQLAYERKASPA